MTQVRYWPKDKPLPEGWTVYVQMGDCHHGHYSVIIRKEEAA